jgi:hypothetical protein
MHLLLRVDKAFRNGIIEKLLALFLESFHFSVLELHTLLLFVLEILTFFAQVLIKLLRFVVGHEFVHVLADGRKFRLFQNRFTKLARFLQHCSIGLCMHKVNSVSATGRVLAICQQGEARASLIIAPAQAVETSKAVTTGL